MFSLKNLSKMSVLSVLDSKNVIKRIKNHVFCSTSCIFSENPCAKMQKKQKSEKTACFSRDKFALMIKHDVNIDFDENTLWILKQKQKSEKTGCFSREKFSLMIKHDVKIDFDENPRWIWIGQRILGPVYTYSFLETQWGTLTAKLFRELTTIKSLE